MPYGKSLYDVAAVDILYALASLYARSSFMPLALYRWSKRSLARAYHCCNLLLYALAFFETGHVFEDEPTQKPAIPFLRGR